MTKVWGFDAPCGPLQFGEGGWRKNALRDLSAGDRVILVGTLGEPTAHSERGMILGMMEPSKISVQTLDFPVNKRHQDIGTNGAYKWPFALLNLRAWKLKKPVPLRSISDRNFSMNAASGIVSLTADEGEKISQLAIEEIELLQPSVRTRRRIEKHTDFKFRSGPAPSTTQRQGIMHMRNAPASTYLLELTTADQRRPGAYVDGPRDHLYKIGWAFDVEKRLRMFNRYALPSHGGLSYELKDSFLWDTARQAFRMEQQLLRHYSRFRCQENSEIIRLPHTDLRRLPSEWRATIHRLANGR